MKLIDALVYIAETAAGVALGMTAAAIAVAGLVVKARKRMLRR